MFVFIEYFLFLTLPALYPNLNIHECYGFIRWCTRLNQNFVEDVYFSSMTFDVRLQSIEIMFVCHLHYKLSQLLLLMIYA